MKAKTIIGNMKARELFKTVKNILLKNEVEAADYEAAELLSAFAGIDRKTLLANPEKEVNPKETLVNLEKRVNGTPLQYIIGKWNFFGYDFFVGDGVLIPRPDTEILVEQAIKEIRDNMRVADLCSGSGCIAITLSKETNAHVFALEKSEKAYDYLLKNIDLNQAFVNPILSDVLEYDNLTDLDVIVSNPPYIKKEVIKTLSTEVQKEPKMALDGGEDGLYFYREITRLWKNKLKHGGKILFEIGFDQAEEVSEILIQNNFADIQVIKDFSGNDRVVKATLE